MSHNIMTLQETNNQNYFCFDTFIYFYTKLVAVNMKNKQTNKNIYSLFTPSVRHYGKNKLYNKIK